MKKILLICGIPRSGTTALARLISSNPKIVLGIERYKSAITSRHFNGKFFEKEKFFDDSFFPTNVNQNRYQQFDKLEARFESCLWIGDKIPNAVYLIPQIFRKFNGNIHFLIILRDPYSVAASWNTRAANPKDRWPASNDSLQCATAYKNLLKTTRDNENIYSQCAVVDYDGLFDMSDQCVAAKLGQIFQHDLDFQSEETLTQIKQILLQYRALSQRRKLLSDIDKANFDCIFPQKNWVELKERIGAV